MNHGSVSRKLTKYLSCFKLNPFVFSKWSTKRPGVQTITWGFLLKIIDCGMMSIPPTIVATRTPIVLPRASNCSEIWNANSLKIVKKRKKKKERKQKMMRIRINRKKRKIRGKKKQNRRRKPKN